MPEKIRTHLLISGRVQGVCFRAATEEEAKAHGLTGWVRNTVEGKVEVVLEGEKEKVEAMVAWCHHGPPAAVVREVKVESAPYKGDIPDFRMTR